MFFVSRLEPIPRASRGGVSLQMTLLNDQINIVFIEHF